MICVRTCDMTYDMVRALSPLVCGASGNVLDCQAEYGKEGGEKHGGNGGSNSSISLTNGAHFVAVQV